MIYTVIIHNEDHARHHMNAALPVDMRAYDWFYATGWGKICPKEAQ